jgi:hypothetical protein
MLSGRWAVARWRRDLTVDEELVGAGRGMRLTLGALLG